MSSASPKVLKQFEKEIAKEGEAEEARIKNAMKDLAITQKELEKAHKVVIKSENDLVKAQKKETEALAALHKVEEEHEIVAAHVSTGQKEFELRREQEAKLLEQAEQRKAQIEAAIREQQTHNEAREAKVAELRHGGCPHIAPGSTQTGSGPTTGARAFGPGSTSAAVCPCGSAEHGGRGNPATGGTTYPPQAGGYTTGGTYGGEPLVNQSHQQVGGNQAQTCGGGGQGMPGGNLACAQEKCSAGGTQAMPGDYAHR